MRILIIEDEHKIAGVMKRGLEKEAFTVDVLYDGEGGLKRATTHSYDLVIVDCMMAGRQEGSAIVKQMRESGLHTPVLMLVAKESERSRASKLDTSADDYLVKPFAFEELLMHVRTLLHQPQGQADSKLTYADIVLDLINFTAWRSGKPIALTQKEFGLLEFFMRNPGKLLSKKNVNAICLEL